MKRFVLVGLLLAGCVHNVHSVQSVHIVQSEPFDDFLFRTENVHCADITAHAEGETPDCPTLFEAFDRGRTRVAKVYPEAASVTMSQLWFYRPKRHWTGLPCQPPDQPWMNLLEGLVPNAKETCENGHGWMPVRGVTADLIPPFVRYAQESVVEHETVHALVELLDGQHLRRQEDIDASPWDQKAPYLWMITCHGVRDDEFGEPGNPASCVQ